MTPSPASEAVHPVRSALRWLVFAACSGGVLYWGVTNLWVALRERRPVEITCADYAAARPSSHWLRLTGCALDVDDIALEKTHEERAGIEVNSKLTAVYMPLRSGTGARGPAHLILRSEDPDLLFLASHSESSSTANEAAERVSKWQSQPIEGLLHFGLDISSKEQRELAQLGLDLAPDYAILEQGAHPYFWFALFAVLAGLAGVGASVWRVASVARERRRATASAVRQ